MFNLPSQRLQPGANSPPPVPHRDDDNEAGGPGEDVHMRDLDSEQVSFLPRLLCAGARNSENEGRWTLLTDASRGCSLRNSFLL